MEVSPSPCACGRHRIPRQTNSHFQAFRRWVRTIWIDLAKSLRQIRKLPLREVVRKPKWLVILSWKELSLARQFVAIFAAGFSRARNRCKHTNAHTPAIDLTPVISPIVIKLSFKVVNWRLIKDYIRGKSLSSAPSLVVIRGSLTRTATAQHIQKQALQGGIAK